jgi:SpoVK/Ycf46/Vps4 family AAA+-type ATPase
MPGVDEREQIWRVQMHPTLTPLAADVNFRALAERHEASGGDIRNAVLKAAMAAASEPGGDAFKAIHQRHLEDGIREVIAAKRVMRQSLFVSETPVQPESHAMGIVGSRQAGFWALAISVLAILLSILAFVVAIGS